MSQKIKRCYFCGGEMLDGGTEYQCRGCLYSTPHLEDDGLALHNAVATIIDMVLKGYQGQVSSEVSEAAEELRRLRDD